MKRCYKCGETRQLSEFYRDNSRPDGLHSKCKPCNHASRRAYMARTGKAHGYRLKEKFNLTVEEYDALLSAQGGGCAICGGQSVNKQRRLAVDHDHKTGEVRGLLCGPCNTAIGLMKEDSERLQRAIDYLEKKPCLTT